MREGEAYGVHGAEGAGVGPSSELGALDFPTRDIAQQRLNAISSGCLRLQVERARSGLQVRYPKAIRVCRGLLWNGDFVCATGPAMSIGDVMRMISFSASTPKKRVKALLALRRIEKWVTDRIAGTDRHSATVRRQQGIYVEQLNAEVAMKALDSQRQTDGDVDEVPF